MNQTSRYKEIADKSLWVEIADKRETLLRWIEKPYIDAGSGTIQIRLDRKLNIYYLPAPSNLFKSNCLITVLIDFLDGRDQYTPLKIPIFFIGGLRSHILTLAPELYRFGSTVI